MLAISALFSCTPELLMDQERQKLDERIGGTTKIEVKYSVEGSETKAVAADSRPQTIDINVDINDENLVWNLESDRAWCKVVPADHKGPGVVSLELGSNETFDPRNQATLTFVAGSFRGFKMTVDQEGSLFLLGQPFILSGKNENNYTVNVTVAKEDGVVPEWNIASDDWLIAEKGGVVFEDGDSQTIAVNIKCIANNSESRYGKLTLTEAGKLGKGEIFVSQFGTEYSYDGSGNIWFDNDKQARIEFKAPAKTISKINCPDYVTYSIEDIDDETVKVVITADENFSDCSEVRETLSSIVLSNASATVVDVPVFIQDYVPAHGLITPAGMLKFAQRVNEGGDTSDWERDGVVVLVGDIDMSSITGWPGIGTASHPFAGEFDGKGFVINNLKKTSKGLFGTCSEASIRNITLGEGCNIYNESTSSTDVFMGGIVGRAESTIIKNVAYSGEMEYCADCDGDNVYVGGVTGFADVSSSVSAAKFGGKLYVSAPKAGVNLLVGGIAGMNFGTTESCESSGLLELTSSETTIIAGGIVSRLADGIKSSGNSFLGSIVLNCSPSDLAVGGLYGEVAGTREFDFAIDKSTVMGSINLKKFSSSTTSNALVGGMIGRLAEASSVTVKGYESMCNITIDHTTNHSGNCLSVGGFIGGTDPLSDQDDAPSSLKLMDLVNRGTISFVYNSTASALIWECTGGIAGYVRGATELSGCSNEASIGDSAKGSALAKSNSKCSITAGILAMVDKGNVTISKCSNSGNIVSTHYNNNAYTSVTSGHYNCDIQSGILGAFNYYSTHSAYTLTMSGCSCLSYVQGYRGICAGMVGYAENATITKCTGRANMSGSSMYGTNAMGNNAAYKGGIAGVLYNSTISDCEVKSDIYATSPGSESLNPGGILSIDLSGTTISGCSYFGNITVGTFNTSYPDDNHIGGIVAWGSPSLTVNDCKLGGVLNGIKLNENNVETNAVGTTGATLNGITYWDGN